MHGTFNVKWRKIMFILCNDITSVTMYLWGFSKWNSFRLFCAKEYKRLKNNIRGSKLAVSVSEKWQKWRCTLEAKKLQIHNIQYEFGTWNGDIKETVYSSVSIPHAK
jgi:hypothetical protein